MKRLWKKVVRMFHPDLHDPEKRKTYERLTRAINEARDEEKWRHRVAGTHRQAPAGEPTHLRVWFSEPSLKIGVYSEKRDLSRCGPTMPRGHDMEHAGARVLPAEMEIFRELEQDEKVIDRIAAAQREELEQEIAGLEKEARAREEEIEELVGDAPF